MLTLLPLRSILVGEMYFVRHLASAGCVGRLLDAILDICGCPPEKFRTICSAIDKLDKMEWSEVQTDLSACPGIFRSF